jgi:hypothetical protein
LRRVGNVAGQRQRHVRLADHGHRFLEVVAVDIEQCGVPAFGQESFGGGAADAAGGAGNEGNF